MQLTLPNNILKGLSHNYGAVPKVLYSSAAPNEKPGAFYTTPGLVRQPFQNFLSPPKVTSLFISPQNFVKMLIFR
jgi:hypothetical protein